MACRYYLYAQDEEKLRLAIKDVRNDSSTSDFCLALLDSSTMELGYHSSGAGYVLNAIIFRSTSKQFGSWTATVTTHFRAI
jgi:hypothetical protein